MKRLILSPLICGAVLLFSLIQYGSPTASAGGSDYLIYATDQNNLVNVRWSNDSQYLVFQDFGLGVLPTEVSWVQYNLPTKHLIKSIKPPLQPILTAAQIVEYQIYTKSGLPLFIFQSPNQRYIVYHVKTPSNWSISSAVPFGIADLTTGEHSIIELPIEFLSVIWSDNSAAFVVQSWLGTGAYKVYYISNFTNSLKHLHYQELSNHAIGPHQIYVDDVYDISDDGTQVLLGGIDGTPPVLRPALWSANNPLAADFFGKSVLPSGARFLPKSNDVVVFFDKTKLTRLNLSTSKSIETDIDWGQIIDQRLNQNEKKPVTVLTEVLISPDLKWVAVTRNDFKQSKTFLYVLPMSVFISD